MTRRAIATAVATAVVVAGCNGTGSAEPGETRVVFTLRPSALRLRIGDTASVAVVVTGLPGRPTIGWTATRPASAAIAAVSSDGATARVIGLAAGDAPLAFTVTSGTQTVSGSVPVTVTP